MPDESENLSVPEGRDTEGQEPRQEPEPEPQEEFDRERALETIHRQRESEKALKKQLQEAKSALKKFEDENKRREDAELSDLQRAQKRITDLEAMLQDAQTMTQALRLRQEFSRVSSRLKLSFVDPQAEEDAFELADMDNVEIDENGKVTGLEEAIKALQKQRPYLFASDERSGKGTPPRTQKITTSGLPGGAEPVKPRIRL